MKTDQDYADAIYEAAKKLTWALNDAAETGLMIDLKISPHGSEYLGQRPLKITSWRAEVDVYRTAHFDRKLPVAAE